MTRRNLAFQKALRFLLTSSALLLLLMAALQFLPELRTKLSAFPSNFAQPPAVRGPDEGDEVDPTESFPTQDLSGSAAGDEAPAKRLFPKKPAPAQSSTLEIESPSPFDEDFAPEPVIPPEPAPSQPDETLMQLEQRLQDLESRDAEQMEARDSQILDQLKMHSTELKAILERIESTEKQVQELDSSKSPKESDALPRIALETVMEDGEEQLEIDAREASLPELLARLGQAAKMNLVVSPDVTGTTSLHLSLPDAQKTLAAVCRIHNLRMEQDGLLMVISRDAFGEDTGATSEIPVLITKLYRLKHLSGSEIRPYVSALLTPESGSVTFASIRERVARTTYRNPPRAILVKDTPSVIAKIDELIQELDHPPADGLRLPQTDTDPFLPPPAPSAIPIRPQPYYTPPVQPSAPVQPRPLPSGPVFPLPVPAGPSCAVPGADGVIFLPPIER